MTMTRTTKSDATEPGRHTPSQPVKRQPAAPGKPQKPTFTDRRSSR